MDAFEEKLHRTWIQLLRDDHHTALAALLRDGALAVTKTPGLSVEHGEEASRELAVEIPHEYYNMIITHAFYPEVIEASPQQAAGYQEENLLMMRNHGFSNSSL